MAGAQDSLWLAAAGLRPDLVPRGKARASDTGAAVQRRGADRDASSREIGRSARHTNETSAGQRAAACTGAVGRPDRNAARWRIRDGEWRCGRSKRPCALASAYGA